MLTQLVNAFTVNGILRGMRGATPARCQVASPRWDGFKDNNRGCCALDQFSIFGVRSARRCAGRQLSLAGHALRGTRDSWQQARGWRLAEETFGAFVSFVSHRNACASRLIAHVSGAHMVKQ